MKYLITLLLTLAAVLSYGQTVEGYASTGFNTVQMAPNQMRDGLSVGVGLMVTVPAVDQWSLPFWVSVGVNYLSYSPIDSNSLIIPVQRNLAATLKLGLEVKQVFYGGLIVAYASDIDRQRGHNFAMLGMDFMISPVRFGQFRPYIEVVVGGTLNNIAPLVTRGSMIGQGKVGVAYQFNK